MEILQLLLKGRGFDTQRRFWEEYQFMHTNNDDLYELYVLVYTWKNLYMGVF